MTRGSERVAPVTGASPEIGSTTAPRLTHGGFDAAHHDLASAASATRRVADAVIAVRRWASVALDEIASLLAFLASPAADHLTGQTTLLDGGLGSAGAPS